MDPEALTAKCLAGTIAEACCQVGLEIAQLHGDGARLAVWDLPHSLQVIYVISVDAQGNQLTPMPAQLANLAGRHLPRSAISVSAGIA